MRRILILPSIACASLIASSASAQSRVGVQIETVNPYASCGLPPDLSNSDFSGTQFAAELGRVNVDGLLIPPSANSCTTNSCWWTDANVFDTDFLDPDTSGANPNDDDTDNFDRSGIAISFFQGHGAAAAFPPDVTCTGSNWTTVCPPHAPAGSTGTGCVITPASQQAHGTGQGLCRWNTPQVFPAARTCGSGDQNGRTVLLSQNVKFGESPTSGAWAGAGLNGGVGMVIFKQSFGLWMPFISQWWPTFAGMDLFAGVAVGYGDSNDSPGFGFAVANPYSVNPAGSVAAGYLSAINNINDGGGCPTAFGGTSFPGGINGCGCHTVQSLGNSIPHTQQVFAENWGELVLGSDASLQTGGGFVTYQSQCNWNPTGQVFGGP